MELSEILSLIVLGLSLIIVVLLILILMKNSNNLNSYKFEDSIIDKVKSVETSINKSIYKSMLDFNNGVNEQLRKQGEMSSENISSFRINVNKELSEFQNKITENLEKDFTSLNQNVEKRMSEINSKVEQRLSRGFHDTNETFIKIAERVQVIDDAQKKIQSLSEEMISLKDILSNNQERGHFGEFQLNQLLRSIFGENKKLYNIQYTFKNYKSGPVRADAVIFLPEPMNMIAIDSKFPFSSYSKLINNKDITKQEEAKLKSDFGKEVKLHITEIAKKYIIPGVTTEYAIMFVPSDGILAFLHNDLINVIEYARSKNVSIVSPTTLIPLLSSFQTIIINYEYNKHTKEIINQLRKIKKDFRIFGEEWAKLNRTIDTLRKDGEKMDSRVKKISSKFQKIDKASFVDETKDNIKILNNK